MYRSVTRIRRAGYLTLLAAATVVSASPLEAADMVIPAGTDGAVLLVAEVDGDPVFAHTGLVFHADDKKAYIAVDGSDWESLSRGQAARIIYRAGFGGEGKTVVVERIATIENGARRIFAGPRESLPTPLPSKAAGTPAEGAMLVMVGVETRIDDFESFHRVAVPVRVEKVLRNPGSLENSFGVAAERPINMTRALLVTADGGVVGTVMPDSNHPRSTSGYSKFIGKPISEIASIGAPESGDIRLNIRPASGRTRIDWLVRPLDPLGRLKRLRMLVRTSFSDPNFTQPGYGTGYAHRLASGLATITVRDGVWVDRPADGQELDLLPDAAIDPLFDLWTDPASIPPGRAWGGGCEFASKKETPLSYRLVEVADDGKYRPLGTTTGWTLDGVTEQFGLAVDDGHRAPTFPRRAYLPTHPRGGTIFTRKFFAAEPVSKRDFSFSSPPKFESLPLLGEVMSPTGFSTASLDVRALQFSPVKQLTGQQLTRQQLKQQQPRPTPAPMAATADGRTLFVVDADEKLRRIDVETWTQTAIVDLGARCEDVSISAAGLVLPLVETDLVLIVDPQTLSLKHVLPADQLLTAVGSPASPYIVVISQSRWEIYDAASGKCESAAPGPIVFAIEGSFFSGSTPFSAAMTDDGRYLFAGSSRVGRFRIEEGELIHEETSPDRGTLNGGRLAVGGDGSRIVLPTKGESPRGLVGLEVQNGLRLSDPPILFDNGSNSPLGAATSTGPVFTNGPIEKFRVFDPATGKLLVEGALGDRAQVVRIFTIAPGDRALYWSNRLTLVDTKPERLKSVK